VNKIISIVRHKVAGFLAGLAADIFPKDSKMGRDYDTLIRRWKDGLRRHAIDIREGRNEKWTTLQALAIYNETVKPKTYTLYDDALKISGGHYEQYNLYLMMQFLHGQVLKDLYTTVLNLGHAKRFPTEKDYVEFLLSEALKQYDKTAHRQPIIDAMKP